jgi:hypothetical protein
MSDLPDMNAAIFPAMPPDTSGAPNWTPLGPSVDVHGQADSFPPVSGRITALAVGPGGVRAYAGTANGGVWRTDNGGWTWSPIDDYVTTATGYYGMSAQADSLAVGALAVSFGATKDDDVIFIGTGEATRNLDRYFGVGVRRFGPPSSGGAPAWTLEATNLAETGFSRIIIDTDNPGSVYAATTAGLFRRNPSGNVAFWEQITPPILPPSQWATDLAAAGSGMERRYYVAYEGGVVWTLDPNLASHWTQLTGITSMVPTPRVVLAATHVPGAAADQTVIYALEQSGNLFRVPPGRENTIFQQVTGTPPFLNGPPMAKDGPKGQGWYDLVVEIEPGTADTIWLVGDFVEGGTAYYDLSLWRGMVDPTTLNFGYSSPTSPRTDPTFMGDGIHPDGHALAFPSDGMAGAVWVGCDGGVFVSSTPGVAGSFSQRNVGLGITQLTYIGQNPDTDAVILSGCQDNGTVRYCGAPSWYEVLPGDGGGVVVDPGNQYRIMRQYVRSGTIEVDSRTSQLTLYSAIWASTDGGNSWAPLLFPPIGRAPDTALQTGVNTEDSNTSFYGRLPSCVDLSGTSLVAFGTNRVWLTADWGATWLTVPSLINPFGSTTPNTEPDMATDVIDGTPITALTMVLGGAGTMILAATSTAVRGFRRPPLVGSTWTPFPINTSALPADRYIYDLAFENADTASPTFYAALGYQATASPAVGTSRLWYFDGNQWIDTQLSYVSPDGTQQVVDVPVQAVVVDPKSSDLSTRQVYVGTDVGCFHGTRTTTPTGPKWVWGMMSAGLPECAITDLAIHYKTRLLRAATHGRGLWEYPLDATSGSDTGVLPQEIYLRLNVADTGHLPGGHRQWWIEGAADPTALGRNVYHWMSPDIKVWRSSLSSNGQPVPPQSPTFYDFDLIQDEVDVTTGLETAAMSGPNSLFVRVQNRGWLPTQNLRVCLLVTPITAGMPPLPTNDYVTPIQSGNTTWLNGSDWLFADPSNPYRDVASATIPLDNRNPLIAAYTNVDFSTLALPGGVDHVCAVAFVVSSDDPTAYSSNSVDDLTWRDRHVAQRNLHLVPVAQTPGQQPAQTPGMRTVLIDFHNTLEQEAQVDLVFDRRFAGAMSVLLSNLDGANRLIQPVNWVEAAQGHPDEAVQQHWQQWIKAAQGVVADPHGALTRRLPAFTAAHAALFSSRVAQLSNLQFDRLWIESASPTAANAPSSFRVSIAPRARITAALTIQLASLSKGQTAYLHVMQHQDQSIVGGSTFVIRG